MTQSMSYVIGHSLILHYLASASLALHIFLGSNYTSDYRESLDAQTIETPYDLRVTSQTYDTELSYVIGHSLILHYLASASLALHLFLGPNHTSDYRESLDAQTIETPYELLSRLMTQSMSYVIGHSLILHYLLDPYLPPISTACVLFVTTTNVTSPFKG